MNYKKILNDEPQELVKKLIEETGIKKAVDIRFEFADKDQWAVISVYLGEHDDELALRLHAEGSYELYIGYYDDEDELQELTRILTTDETKNIPKGLRKVMSKVVTDEEGLRVPGSILVA